MMQTDWKSLKHKSKEITEGPDRAPARAMLRAMGLNDDDLDKPFIGVANLASDVTPCNVHLGKFTQAAKQGVRNGNGTPFEFGTITVSDGISMGTEGMKASLVSREVIADSIEVVTFGERMDGLITVAGCDKNMPGCMMAIARLNIPSIFIYGGSIMPGQFQGRDVNIQDVFEAVGAYSKGSISAEDLYELECNACPGEGSCAGLFTANTMSTAIEILGLSLPGDASIPAINPNKVAQCEKAGEVLMQSMAAGITPRDILTREAFLNAITVVVSMGGSTNSVLHLMAIAREAEVDLSLDDFDKLSRNTPYIADMKPGGRYVMADLDRYGGVALIGKRLLDAGLLNGDTLAVNGKTLGENLSSIKTTDDQPIISDVSSISEDVSKKSDWYNSIVNKSGKDGLKNILNIMKKTHIHLNKNGIFIFPIISLSNITKLEKTCPKIFSNFKKTKKVFWPLPFFFKKNIEKFHKLKENKYIYFESKYGMYIAFTQIGICKI